MPARVTSEQLALLEHNVRHPISANAMPPRRKAADLPENILEAQICGFLRVRAWLLIRQHVGLYVPFRETLERFGKVHPIRIGERGAADWLAVRPWVVGGYKPHANPHGGGLVELFWWEAKAPGKRPRPEQLKWLEDRRAVGFECDWFDDLQDFPGPHSFVGWYKERFE